MKLLLTQNVRHLGQIGDVVKVRPGYGRNYLLPQGLAVEATDANLKAIEAAKAAYLTEMAKKREELQARADALRGKEITISARANEQGHLYGSIGPAQIAAVLAADGIFIEARDIQMPEPIRQLDKYDVKVVFDQDVQATIQVWVVPAHEAEEEPQEAPAEDAEAAAAAEQAPPAEDAPPAA